MIYRLDYTEFQRYAGIGSRETPKDVLKIMREIGRIFAIRGILLRSGAALGADAAFESGCDTVYGPKEIYLPWMGFNGHKSLLYAPSYRARELAEKVIPHWDRLTFSGKKLHARNCHQILGKDLDLPVNAVICWTKEGKLVGGTATAIRLAEEFKILVLNLANDEDRELVEEWMV